MSLVFVLKKLLPYIVVTMVIIGVGWWLHHSGYESGRDDMAAEYEQQIAQERRRVQAANDAALEAARKVEQKLRSDLGARNEIIRRLSQEARDAPGSDVESFDVDSVRRLNEVLK